MALHLSTPEAATPQPTQPTTPTISSTEPDLTWVSEPGADPQPAPAPGGDGFEIRDPDQGNAPGQQLMSRDEFFAMFGAICEAPNIVLAMKKQPPLKSLGVDPGDPAARGASDALYDTCRDVPWLRFMLGPDQVWMQRLMPVAAFGWTKYRLVRGELAERGKAAAENGSAAAEKGRFSQSSAGKDTTSSAEIDERGQKNGGNQPIPQDSAPGVDQGVVELKVGVPAK